MDADFTPPSESDEGTGSSDGIPAELIFPGTTTDHGSLSVTTPDHLLSEHILGSIPLWEAKGRPTGAERASYQKQIYRDVWRNSRLCKVSLVVYGSGDLGLPNSIDLEFFRGFERWTKAALSRGEPFNQLVKISGRELLEASGKGLGGASYQEMDRFFLRMAGTMIGAGRDWRQEGESGGSEKRPRSNKGIVFHIFQTVVLPGQVNAEGYVADKYEVELATWYWMSLRSGNCIVIDHELFRDLHGSITKLLHQLLHNLFYLGRGTASQKYSELVRNWQIKRHSALSLVKQQLDDAHRELLEKEFISRWEYVPIRTPEGKEFEIIWEAGPAWWATDKKTREFREEMVGANHRELQQIGRELDPFLLIEQSDESNQEKDGQREASNARLLSVVLEISGKRKDPKVWEKWWKRAITSVPHPMIWRRIGEVKERRLSGQTINQGSYLLSLIRGDAARLGLPWATSDKVK
ncbi:MAG TPA: replication initiator protein A [Nitrospira sp.]|jgi:hypothetical protein|nr:replication initiator protein A [Fimbriimonadaceae bacterium]MBX7039779.1 replication initiator protein A [Nitrospira sp.]HMU29008.1 replication initiator protein A [Nitrospira sp.]HMV58367.1 replication initiator protein A [Nitrospira sp.]HMW85055.1 replication initiator protein A [Nitrospira sp.]